MRDHSPLPGWPRGLREEMAADYVGLSKGTFRTEVGAGRAPAPIRITPGRIIWLRDALDKWLDDLAGKPGAGPDRPAAVAVSEWDAACGIAAEPAAPPMVPRSRTARRRTSG
jgi:predicted DNA-binding transcriptional regulator AlpA